MSGNGAKDFHVAIIGAGIAGLALAIALHNKEIPFTLYEAAKEYSAVGAGIGFAPNGLRAMDLIEPRFRAEYEAICVGNKPMDAQHVFFEGMLLEQGLGRDKSWYGNSSWGHPNFTRKSAHRKALLDIMTSYIPMSRVKFKKRLISIEQHPDEVLLHFEDGETASASLLAGADGIKSLVRSHVLAPLYPNEVDAVYADSYCYRGVIPIKEAEEILGTLTDVAKFYFGYGRSAVTYRISGGEEFNFLLCVATTSPWPAPDAVTQIVSHESMMADFGGDGVDSRFRQLLRKAKPIQWGFFHHYKTSTYVRGRVVLLGDAAHASLPFQAAGAAQGVEDAVLLSCALAEVREGQRTCMGDVMAAYDAVRRPRAQKQLEQSSEVCRMLFLQHEEAGDDMHKILKRLQNGRFDWLWFHDLDQDVKVVVDQARGTKIKDA